MVECATVVEGLWVVDDPKPWLVLGPLSEVDEPILVVVVAPLLVELLARFEVLVPLDEDVA